ncbi:unnamed protein product [Chrysoparadoxa australica]
MEEEPDFFNPTQQDLLIWECPLEYGFTQQVSEPPPAAPSISSTRASKGMPRSQLKELKHAQNSSLSRFRHWPIKQCRAGQMPPQKQRLDLLVQVMVRPAPREVFSKKWGKSYRLANLIVSDSDAECLGITLRNQAGNAAAKDLMEGDVVAFTGLKLVKDTYNDKWVCQNGNGFGYRVIWREDQFLDDSGRSYSSDGCGVPPFPDHDTTKAFVDVIRASSTLTAAARASTYCSVGGTTRLAGILAGGIRHRSYNVCVRCLSTENMQKCQASKSSRTMTYACAVVSDDSDSSMKLWLWDDAVLDMLPKLHNSIRDGSALLISDVICSFSVVHLRDLVLHTKPGSKMEVLASGDKRAGHLRPRPEEWDQPLNGSQKRARKQVGSVEALVGSEHSSTYEASVTGAVLGLEPWGTELARSFSSEQLQRVARKVIEEAPGGKGEWIYKAFSLTLGDERGANGNRLSGATVPVKVGADAAFEVLGCIPPKLLRWEQGQPEGQARAISLMVASLLKALAQKGEKVEGHIRVVVEKDENGQAMPPQYLLERLL